METKEQKQFNFLFTEIEANTVLNALATLPFHQVAALINSIQKQASEQMEVTK